MARTMKQVSALMVAALLLLAGALALCLMPATAHAAVKNSKAETLMLGPVVFSGYDVDGDGSNDTIKCETYGEKTKDYMTTYAGVKVYVNDAQIADLKGSDRLYSPMVSMQKMDNGQCFLSFTGDTRLSRIYAFKDGKLSQALNMKGIIKGVDIVMANSVKAAANTLKIDYEMWYGNSRFGAEYVYKYASGKLTRTSNTGTYYDPVKRKVAAQSMKANIAMTAYKDTSCKKKAFDLSKSAKVKAQSIYANGKTVLLKLKNSSGKTGYVKLNKYGIKQLGSKGLFNMMTIIRG